MTATDSGKGRLSDEQIDALKDAILSDEGLEHTMNWQAATEMVCRLSEQAKLAPRPTGALPEEPEDLIVLAENNRAIGERYHKALRTAAASIEAENQRLQKVVDAYPAIGGKTSDEYTLLFMRYQDSQSELSSLRGRLEGVEKIVSAANKLVERLGVIHADPTYESVWIFYQLHIGEYRGPKYADELAELRAALAR